MPSESSMKSSFNFTELFSVLKNGVAASLQISPLAATLSISTQAITAEFLLSLMRIDRASLADDIIREENTYMKRKYQMKFMFCI